MTIFTLDNRQQKTNLRGNINKLDEPLIFHIAASDGIQAGNVNADRA